MARDFFKIDKGLTLRPRSSEPSNPVDGDSYYDSTLGKFRFYQNGAWINLGSGNVEQALLFQLLADNGMEEIAFDSFDAESTDFLYEVFNMTLDNTDGSYSSDNADTVVQWDGWREPDQGETGTTYTASFGGSNLASVSNGVLEIVGATDGLSNYYYDLPQSDYTDGEIFVEWEARITAEGTSTNRFTPTKNSFDFGVLVRDGGRRIDTFYLIDDSTGTRQIAFVDIIDDEILTDADTGELAIYDVDWTQFHKYAIHARDDDATLFVDGQRVARVAKADFRSDAQTRVQFGSVSSSESCTSEWKYLNFGAFNSRLVSKVLLNRGTFAFEGDGDPTSATSAGTIQEITGSDDYFTEDNWQQWTNSGTATTSVLNSGDLNAKRRIEKSTSNSRYYYYNGALADPLINRGYGHLQCRVKVSNLDLQNTTERLRLMALRGANKYVHIALHRTDSQSNTIGTLSLGYRDNTTVKVLEDDSAGSGSGFQIVDDEEHTLDLIWNNGVFQFLVDGKIQQEINETDVPEPDTSDPIFIWGAMPASGLQATLDFDYARVSVGDERLPKSPINEFLAVCDLKADNAFASFSSDGKNWTFPKPLSTTGASDLIAQDPTWASGYPQMRVMISNETDAQIDNFAALFNLGFRGDGLTTQYVKTFEASEFTNEPGDQILEHNLKAAEDEVILFGGTNYLVKDLDWFFVDSDRILIKNAVSGVPYVARRIGFNLGETKNTVVVDRENKPAIEDWQDWTPTFENGSNITINVARYRRVGNAVQFHLDVDGNGAGSGGIFGITSLPVALGGVNPSLVTVGTCYWRDSSTNENFSLTALGTKSDNRIQLRGDGSGDSAFILRGQDIDDSDSISINGFYEIDEADGYYQDVVTNVSNVGNNDTGVVTVQRKKVETIGKVQTKTLSSNVTSNGVMSDLTTTLEIGKKYEIFLNPAFDVEDDDSIFITAVHDGNDIALVQAGNINNADGNLFRLTKYIEPFVATATNVTFEVGSISAGSEIRGDGSKLLTHVIVREINEEEVVENVTGRTNAEFQEIKKTRYGLKVLSGTFNTPSTILSDLTFNNLEVGKTYRITLNGEVDTAAGFTTLYLQDNGTDILRVGIDGNDGGSTDEETVLGASKTIIHTMTSNTLEVELRSVGTGGNVFGDNTKVRTSLLVEEIQFPENSLS